jgi:hypothetical protein
MNSLPPIEPDLITAYQARVVALAAEFLVAILAAGPRSPQDVGAAADAALLTRGAVHEAAKGLRLRRRAGWRLPGPKTSRGRQARRDPIAGPVLAASQ